MIGRNRGPTNLSVGDADESLVHQFVPQGVPGLALHDVTLCCFVGQRDGWYLTGETNMQTRRCYTRLTLVLRVGINPATQLE